MYSHRKKLVVAAERLRNDRLNLIRALNVISRTGSHNQHMSILYIYILIYYILYMLYNTQYTYCNRLKAYLYYIQGDM